MLELLAPAGGKEHFLAAVDSGADAVYFGLKRFSARNSAENFDFEQLDYCLKYAKTFGVRAYAAMNTLVKDSERKDFIETVLRLYEMGVDGFIVQDIFLGKRIKAEIPEIRLHLSTQGGACNAYAAEVAKEFGFSRIVAARETTLEDLSEMAKIIEVESFVQGALCTSFSGECYASAFIGGNSANRGRCKQPCRMKYSLNGAKPDYAICLKDLSVGPDIAVLRDTGVSALKIEGRMRRPEYVSAAVKYYKKLMSGMNALEEFSALKRSYNRGDYTAAAGRKNDIISKKAQGHIGEAVGTVIAVTGNRIKVSSNLKPEKGDAFKILRNGEETGSAIIRKVIGSRGRFEAEYRGAVKPGDEVRITTDVGLNEKLLSSKRLLPLSVTVRAMAGKPVSVTAEGGGRKTEHSGEIAAAAENRPLSAEEIKEVFSKTDKFPFAPEITVETDGAFIPRSVLNAIRRGVYSDFFEGAAKRRAPLSVDIKKIIGGDCDNVNIAENNGGKKSEILILSSLPVGDGKTVVFAPDDYFGTETRKFIDYHGEKYLYLLPEFSRIELDSLEKTAKAIGGIYCENLSGIALARKWGVALFLGTGMNIFNGTAAGEAAKTCDRFALSKELSVAEAEQIACGAVLRRGNVKLMDLAYCPYGGDCKNCSAKAIGTLTDEGGRSFKLRRVRLKGCYFELYNCADLYLEDDERHDTLKNFVLYDRDTATTLAVCGKNAYSKIYPVTSGTGRRGVE